MFKLLKYITLLLLLCIGFQTKAQDTLSLYQNIENQNHVFRSFNKEYYYNPANMLDYSNHSFSTIQLNYQTQKKNTYLLPEGSGLNQFKLETASYKKKQNNALWGSASYTQSKVKNVQWNNNVDLDRIASIAIADSVGGTLNKQTYNFTGGFAQQLNKLTLALALDYTATLGYKTQDPRPKNTTSDLNLQIGAHYPVLTNYKVGVFAGLNKYIQATEIAFSSEIQKTPLYQMNGLGSYNFFFSNKTTNAYFKDFVYHYGLTFGTLNNTFNISVGSYKGRLVKDAATDLGKSSYEINRIQHQTNFISALKLFNLNQQFTVGVKAQYNNTTRKGFETLYTNNSNVLSKLLESENYAYKTNQLKAQLLVQYQTNNSTLAVTPYFTQQKNTEDRFDNNSYQHHNYNYIGTTVFYLQHLNANNVINVQLNAYQRKVTKASNYFNTYASIGINNWLMHDYDVKSSQYNALTSAVTYHTKIHPKRALYAIFAVDYIEFHNKNTNTQTTLTVGVTF